MADCHACDKGFCCSATLELGREEMKSSVSVFGSFDPKQCLCLCVDKCMHMSISVVWLHVFLTIRSFCIPFITGALILELLLSGVYRVFLGFRYPPSSRQTSHEEGKEWLRSHSTGGLQDTGSQSPLSPPGASCITTGKYHYSNLRKSKKMNAMVQICSTHTEDAHAQHVGLGKTKIGFSPLSESSCSNNGNNGCFFINGQRWDY